MAVLVFDFDGVLADSLKEGFDVALKLYKKYGFKGVDSLSEFLDLYEDNYYKAIVDKGFDPKDMDAYVKELKLELEKAYKAVKPFDGLKHVLQELMKDNAVVVITSNMTSVVEEFIRRYDFPKMDVIGADVEKSKVKKLEKIRRNLDGEVFYIGDTVGDIKEGKKAKATTVAVTWGWHDRDRLERAKPDFIVDRPNELLELSKVS